VGGVKDIKISRDLQADNFSFVFTYNTVEKEAVRIEYVITYEWIFHEDLNVEIREDVVGAIDFGAGKDRYISQFKQYATLFWQKTGNYFKKTNGVMFGDAITTKVIRMTADNLNQKEQIVLNKSALLSCELEDLLK